MEEDEEVQEGPAKNIGELTLVCLELASKVGEASTDEEKLCLIKDHIQIYNQNEIPMVDFEPGLEWFNVSCPLTLAGDLKGRISVLDFFTYCCINCMHILPDLEALEDQHPPEKGEVLVVGVHSAKFENERVSANIIAALQKYHIHHPVVNDAQAKMWMQLGIACWPTLLILGPNGHPLFVLVGEGHRQRLLLYISMAVEYFSEIGALTKTSVPVAPSTHVEATGSLLLYPGKVATYPDGIVVSDSGHNRILIVDKKGTVKNIIGSGARGFSDGSFSCATFNNPQGIVFHHPNTIYVADTDNHAVRQIDLASKDVKTLVGTGKQGFDFEGGQEGRSQAISSPWDLSLARSLDVAGDAEENLLVIAMAGTHQIWGLFLSDGKWLKGSAYGKGTAVRLAGSGAEENRNTTYPIRAGFAQPSGVALGTYLGQPVIYIADAESSSIRKFNLADGAVKGVVGAARDPLDLFAYGDADGTGVDAKLQHPLGVATLDEAVYVADSYNHKIKIVKVSGKSYTAATVAGTGKPGNTEGIASEAQFNEPGGICISKVDMCVYIADTNNHAIKVLSLEDNHVRELVLTLLDESDSFSQDLCNLTTDVEEMTVEVLPGMEVKALLKLQLDLPSGASLNREAPSMWKMQTSDDCITMRSTHGELLETTDVPVSLNLSSNENCEALLHINAVMYICLSSGVCVKKNSSYDIKFIVINPDESNFRSQDGINVDILLKVKDITNVYSKG